MNMIHYRPWTLARRLHSDLDQLLERQSGENGDDPRAFGDWMPAVDIKEEERRFVISADIPGVLPDDIEVTLENNVLNLRGERKEEVESDPASVHRFERRHGKFMRRFTLPETVDADEVTARSTNGVLEVTILKKAEVSPRRIAVKVD